MTFAEEKSKKEGSQSSDHPEQRARDLDEKIDLGFNNMKVQQPRINRYA